MSEYPSDWNSRRKRVYKRDNHRCQSCGRTGGPLGNTELHAHHIVPKSRGGSHDLSNLTTLCKSCHNDVHSDSKTRSWSSSPSSSPDKIMLPSSVAIHVNVLFIATLLWFIPAIVYISLAPPFLPLGLPFTLPLTVFGIGTMNCARNDNESARIGTCLLGLMYIGLGMWFWVHFS